MKATIGAVGGKAKAYAFSAVGVLHSCALVSSFITFVCNESATWCRGNTYCAVPIYKPTYTYFSAIALAAFVISGIFYVLHCTGMYDKLRFSSRRKLLVELSCVIAIVFFFAFGNLFMISRTGNRIVYMISTCFGFVATLLFGVQLVLIFRWNYSRLIAEERDVESAAADIDSDDSACPDGEPNVKVTVIKSWNMGDHSPGNLSQKDSNSLDNLESNSLGNLSVSSSSTGKKFNPSMVDNEDYCTSSSEDNPVELKNKLTLSD